MVIPLDAHVTDLKRSQMTMVPDLKMHKAFHLYEGLNGIDVAVFETFSSTLVPIPGERLAGHDEYTAHYLLQTTRGGRYCGNSHISELPTTYY